MQEILSYIASLFDNAGFAGYLPLAVAGILFIWIIVLTIVLLRQVRTNRSLLGGATPRSLKELVLEQMNKVGGMEVELTNMEHKLSVMKQRQGGSVQKVGLTRFSPFEDTGSDQSFALALLDASDSGVIITSLHGRDRTRMYVKPVRNGSAEDYELSEEELEAIKKAQLIEN